MTGREIQVGKIAREKLVTHPQDIAQLFKLHMGPTNTLSKRAFQMEELSACVLKQLVADAGGLSRSDGDRAKLLVCRLISTRQRWATKKAGELPGPQGCRTSY